MQRSPQQALVRLQQLTSLLYWQMARCGEAVQLQLRRGFADEPARGALAYAKARKNFNVSLSELRKQWAAERAERQEAQEAVDEAARCAMGGGGPWGRQCRRPAVGGRLPGLGRSLACAEQHVNCCPCALRRAAQEAKKAQRAQQDADAKVARRQQYAAKQAAERETRVRRPRTSCQLVAGAALPFRQLPRRWRRRMLGCLAAGGPASASSLL